MANPFDQFATELNSALPPGAGPAPADDNPFSFAPPTPAPLPSDKPVMNAPPQQMNNGYGGGYGQPPMGAPMGAPPPMYGGMGGQMGGQPLAMNGMGGPPPSQGNFGGMPMGGPPPPGGGGDPFSGYVAPAPEQHSSQFAAPPQPQGSQDPFAAYGAPMSGPPQPSAGQDPYGAPQQAPPTPNPYGPPPPQQAPPSAPPTPNPYAAHAPTNALGGNDPFSSYGAPPQNAGYGQHPPQGAPPPSQTQYGQPPISADPFAGYGAPPPTNDPFGGYGAPLPQQSNPYGAPPPDQGALVVSQNQSNPYAMALPPQQQHQPPPPAAAVDPFSVFNQAPAPPPPAPAAPPAPYSQAMVPAQPPEQHYYQHQPPPPADGGGGGGGGDGDLWGDLGFDAPPEQQHQRQLQVVPKHEEEKKDSGDLPPGGEYYDARIFTPTLGVMFFKPQELTDSLFLNTERDLVDSLGERPVVAFIVEGSSARSAGVELGHVLLKVNGVDVRNPKEASRLIKEGPRPLPLLFYVPNTEVVVAEGEHMVKYDTRETTAPNSAKDWKPKYVVIGGIIAQPWMINMYRSKSEYDIAVIETQARRPVSVKVKQFSLQGARIQNDWQGPQMVKYKNKLHPWKYIVVLPVARNPIKISSPNLASLKPVHEGIRRVLLAQQRGRGGNQHSAAPQQREPHRPAEHYQQQPPQHQAPPQGHYSQQQYGGYGGY